jgi:hypothetical protein
VAESIASPYKRAAALGKLARKLAEAGRTQEAQARWRAAGAAARSETFPRFRVEALAALAVQCAAVRGSCASEVLFADALRDARGIGGRDEHRLAMREVAAMLATAGRCAAGLDVAREVTDDDGYTIHEVAVHCTNKAELDPILASLDHIKYPDHRGQALAALAVRQAESGPLARAMATLSRSADPPSQARALADIAAGKLSDGSTLTQCP